MINAAHYFHWEGRWYHFRYTSIITFPFSYCENNVKFVVTFHVEGDSDFYSTPSFFSCYLPKQCQGLGKRVKDSAGSLEADPWVPHSFWNIGGWDRKLRNRRFLQLKQVHPSETWLESSAWRLIQRWDSAFIFLSGKNYAILPSGHVGG